MPGSSTMAPALGPSSGGDGSSSSTSAGALDGASASHLAGGSDIAGASGSSGPHYDAPKQCTHCGAALEGDEPMNAESGAADASHAASSSPAPSASAVPPEQPSPSARVFAPPPRAPDPAATTHAPLAAQLCPECRARRDLARLFADPSSDAARHAAGYMDTDAPEREALASPPWLRWTSAPLTAPASRSRHVSPSRGFDTAAASSSSAVEEQHMDVAARHSSPAAAPLLSQRSLSSQSRGSASGGAASGSSSHADSGRPATTRRPSSSRARGASFSRSSTPHAPAAAPARGEVLAVNLPRSARASSSSSSSGAGEQNADRRSASESAALSAPSSSFGPHLLSRPRLSSITAAEAEAPLHLPLYAALQQRRAAPDPRADISLLRYRTRGKGCLVPGATFTGTQKSGRSSYEVGVQIVNVDLDSSHLCGYLNIRGLTEDWPELTTFFDAEIIGDRYSFVTNKWGAKESSDMTHWKRFSPFGPLRRKLGKDGRFNHLNQPFIFMRWKERFLVPDHRVRDINGASFAGFYYVCVELGDETAAETRPSRSDSIGSLGAAEPDSPSAHSRADTADEDYEMEQAPQQSVPLKGGRMVGYYFHENSEPYQQLTLQHQPEPTSSTFELH